MTAHAGLWYAVEGAAGCYEMLADGAGVVTLEKGNGVWWLRTPGDPDGYRVGNLGSGSVRTAKVRANLELALRARERERRGFR